MLKILIVNDDGIQSEGLQVLAETLAQKHEIYICAPDTQRSASSHCVTYFLKDLIAKEMQFPYARKAWAVSGMPADCVYAAVNGLLDESIDLVVSGINDGPNYSTDTIYSGTIAAAEEGMILGIPSIAVSLHKTTYGYQDAANIVMNLIDDYMQLEGKSQFTLSVNIPALPLSEMKGIRVCNFDGKRQYGRRLQVIDNHDGTIRLHSLNEDIPLLRDNKDGRGDVTNLEDGYITISALDADIIHKEYNDMILKLEKSFNH